MARVTPKTNWVASDIPTAPDFNRIEGNAQQAFDEIDAEESARIAAVNAEESARIADVNAEEAARIADVNAEESSRMSADNILQSQIDAISANSSGFDYKLKTHILAAYTVVPSINSTHTIYRSTTNTASFTNYSAASFTIALSGTWAFRGTTGSGGDGLFERIS